MSAPDTELPVGQPHSGNGQVYAQAGWLTPTGEFITLATPPFRMDGEPVTVTPVYVCLGSHES